jgi:hypothetical protein
VIDVCARVCVQLALDRALRALNDIDASADYVARLRDEVAHHAASVFGVSLDGSHAHAENVQPSMTANATAATRTDIGERLRVSLAELGRTAQAFAALAEHVRACARCVCTPA